MQQDKTMNANDKVTQKENENPFKDMGFIKFWVVSTIFWFSFPMSLVLCYLALGSVRTRQLVKALVHDFLQTLFIIMVVVSVIIYFIYQHFSALFYNTSYFLNMFT
jgi:hypothetical protein